MLANTVEGVLAHHGVLGMKWGHHKISEVSGSKSSSSEKKPWSTKKKIAVGGAAAVGIGLATYGAYKLHDKRLHNRANFGKETLSEMYKGKTTLRGPKEPSAIMKDVVSKINPKFGEAGTTSNCRRCTFAYELRRRGFDVKATKSVGRLQGPEDLVTAISGGSKVHELTLSGLGKRGVTLVKEKPGQNASRIFNSLKQHPEGARGELGMSFGRVDANHSMAWEIIKGKVHVFDAQTGEHYATPREFHKIAKHISDAAFTRLDDVELNPRFVSKWVSNA